MTAVSGFSNITVDPLICGGRPVIIGTRMRVVDILDMLGDGASESEILTDFPYVKANDIRSCLAYAASLVDHPVVIAAE